MAEERDAGKRAPDQAAALAVALAHGGDRADVFLEEQTRLTRLQIEEIEEENPLRRRILRIEHVSGLMKLALELAAAFIVVLIAAAIAASVWSAAQDNGLVVESFSVPPDLAGRGLTGEVVAARLLDKLAALQARTVSHRAASSYANNWGNDIKVQIPDTGVSIGEFNRDLRQWLGHETHISGEVWRTPGGIAVTARAGGDASPTFTGTDADLDRLLQQAAEAVYARTQPYRYAVYLGNVGRTEEANAMYRRLLATGAPRERAWAAIGLGNYYQARGDVMRSVAMTRDALALRPDFVMAYLNTGPTELQRGHDEAALAAERKAVALLKRGDDPDFDGRTFAVDLPMTEAQLAADLGDYNAQLAFDREAEALPDLTGQAENARQNDIGAYAQLHDGAAMRQAIAALPPSSDPNVALNRAGTFMLINFVMGRWQAVLSGRAGFESKLLGLGLLGQGAVRRQLWPAVAAALAQTGDFKGAHALIDRTPPDCTLCLRMRANIDAAEKNWRGAAYWFERAARYAPSLPIVDQEWGAMLLAKGDPDGAIAEFESAHRKGPHFADPLEGWGEALMAKNRSDLAPAKFEDAARYAPNWGRLHLKWGEALFWSGRRDEARGQFAVASGLDLSAAEKSELAKAAHG